MAIRIRSWKQVFAYSAATTMLAVCVPLAVVDFTLWRMPFIVKLPILAISGLIPLLITIPISIFALYLVKTLHHTMDTLDSVVKYDPMTGLMARVHFINKAEQHRKDGGYLALLDADHFKKLNDTYGHAAGDLALKYLADTMVQVVGVHGFVGRFGGEEFVIRLPKVARAQAELLFSALGTQLRNNGVMFGAHLLKPTLSIGVVYEDGLRPFAAALRDADSCLYQAKHAGRDQFIFEERLDEQARSAA